MNGDLVHRGPDDEGYFESPTVGLAMRRLSIVDIAGGRQPIGNEDGSLQVVCNGEIYNYIELRREVEKRGHRLSTQGDVEVLVHLYEDFGVEMLSRLRGMFAFALWDSKRETLFLARDRLGKKPLCYATTGNRLLFSSEIHPLVANGGLSTELDPDALARYLLHGYVPSPRTIYRDIRKLPPAHYLLWRQNEMRIQRYWRLDFERKFEGTRDEGKIQVRDKLDESIRLRLRSDVPLGLLLSGGLDSNAILARLARGLRHPVRTFTIGFEEKDYDESGLARLSARHFGTEHTDLPGRVDLLDLVPKLVRHYGEPFADKSALPSFLVSELTRQQVKVALNGDGGDEAFAGYSKYRLSRWQKISTSLMPRALRRRWNGSSLTGIGLLGGRGARHLRRLVLPDTESLFTNEFLSGRHFAQVTTPEFRSASEAGLVDSFAEFTEGASDIVDRMLHWDYEHYLPDDLLVKMDIASMANGLEVRSPMLDHELVELCASLPSVWKGSARIGKQLLRDLVEADLPPEVTAAPKRGFSVPLAEWWRGPARKKIRENLADLHPSLRPFMNHSYMMSLLDDHQQGRRNHAQRLWCLAVLNAWAWSPARSNSETQRDERSRQRQT